MGRRGAADLLKAEGSKLHGIACCTVTQAPQADPLDLGLNLDLPGLSMRSQELYFKHSWLLNFFIK
jgi:hypothetical protein